MIILLEVLILIQIVLITFALRSLFLSKKRINQLYIDIDNAREILASKNHDLDQLMKRDLQ